MAAITIGERIRLIRKENGDTLEQFSAKIGVSHPALSQIETGKNNPSGSTIKMICKEFAINEEWLRTGVGEKNPTTPKFQRLMNWIADVALEDDTARLRIVEALTTLKEEDWEILERIAKKIADRDDSPSA